MTAIIKKVTKRLVKSAKTNDKRVHITPRSTGWAVRKEGSLHPFKVVRTQKEAIEVAKDKVRSGLATKVVIHTKSGKFRIAK